MILWHLIWLTLLRMHNVIGSFNKTPHYIEFWLTRTYIQRFNNGDFLFVWTWVSVSCWFSPNKPVFVTHAKGSRMVRFCRRFSSCFSAQHVKTDAAWITRLDIQMFHDESWKPICSRVKWSRSKVGLCTWLQSCECWRFLVHCARVCNWFENCNWS